MCRDLASRSFSSLVKCRVSSVDIRLDFPDLMDSTDVVVPTFRKPDPMEVGGLCLNIGAVE